MEKNGHILQQMICFLLKAYQWVLSPFLKQSCRYYPSCSQYAIDAVLAKGALKGLALAMLRLVKCHPWAKGGYDPVLPKREKSEWI